MCLWLCVCVLLCADACPCPTSVFLYVEELSVSRLVGLCGGFNSLARQAWLSSRETQSNMFILHLRRQLADEDVHMQDWR